MRRCPLDVLWETSPEFLRIPAADRGNYHALLVYCALHENDGFIADCHGWTNEDWRAIGLRGGRWDVHRLEKFELVAWESGSRAIPLGTPGLAVRRYDMSEQRWVVRGRRDCRNYRELKKCDAQRQAVAQAVAQAEQQAEQQPVRQSPSGPDPDPDPSLPPPISRRRTTTTAPTSGAPIGGGGDAFGDERTGPDGFEEAWSLHPKAAPWMRDAALELWAALDLEAEAEAIIADLRAPPEHWRRSSGRYATNPLMYLKRREWTTRRRRKPKPPSSPPPAKPRAPEVYIPAPNWPPPDQIRAETPTNRASLFLIDKKDVS